jgi:hypothetical protein
LVAAAAELPVLQRRLVVLATRMLALPAAAFAFGALAVQV